VQWLSFIGAHCSHPRDAPSAPRDVSASLPIRRVGPARPNLRNQLVFGTRRHGHEGADRPDEQVLLVEGAEGSLSGLPIATTSKPLVIAT
jgi:hypothetical protein